MLSAQARHNCLGGPPTCPYGANSRSLLCAQQRRTLSWNSDEEEDTDRAPGFALSGAKALLKPHDEAPKAKRPRLNVCSPLLTFVAQPAALPHTAEPAALPLTVEAAAAPLCISAKRKSEGNNPRRASAFAVAAAPRAAVAAKAPLPRRKAAAPVMTAAVAVVPRTLLECKVFLAPGLVPQMDRTFIQARQSKLGKVAVNWGPDFTHIVVSFADKLKDDEGAKKRVLRQLRPWVLAAPQAVVVAPTWLVNSLKADRLLPYGPSDLLECDSLARERAPAALPVVAPPLQQLQRAPSREHYACQPHLRESVRVVNVNSYVCVLFLELAEIYTVKSKASVQDSDYYRGRAFGYAARLIAQLDFPLNIPEDAIRARNEGLLDLGSSCFETLIEILEEMQRCAGLNATGCAEEPRLPQRLRMLYADPIVIGTRELRTVFGIGPAEARDLWAVGIRSVVDLRKWLAAGAGLKLNECVLVGLPFHEDIQHRIPRAEVSVFLYVMQRIAERLAPGVRIQAVGSFRRGAATSGDVDILVTHPDDETGRELLKLLVKALLDIGLMTAELAGGSRKMEEIRQQEKDGCGAWSNSFMGIGKLPESLAPSALPRPLLHRRIDIKVYAMPQCVPRYGYLALCCVLPR